MGLKFPLAGFRRIASGCRRIAGIEIARRIGKIQRLAPAIVTVKTIAAKEVFGMDSTEIARLQDYMRSKFGVPNLIIRARPKKDDSAEVYFGEEFIGVVFRDDEDGDVSYDFNMAILEIDLPERPVS